MFRNIFLRNKLHVLLFEVFTNYALCFFKFFIFSPILINIQLQSLMYHANATYNYKIIKAIEVKDGVNKVNLMEKCTKIHS